MITFKKVLTAAIMGLALWFLIWSVDTPVYEPVDCWEMSDGVESYYLPKDLYDEGR